MSSRACLTAAMSIFFAVRSDAFMICLTWVGGAGGKIFPSGFAVVAAMRALILELAAECVFRAAMRRPVQIVLRGRDRSDGRVDEFGRQRRRCDAQRTRKGAKARRVLKRKTRCQRVGFRIVLVQRSTQRVLPSASEFSWLMTSVSVWIRPAIRLFSLRARAIETCCFIVSPEEILHHCVHSSVPFGVAGRLTAKV